MRGRITHKPKPKPENKLNEFDDYFQECIKNKKFHPIHHLIFEKL